MSAFHNNPLIVTLTPGERWALTKGIFLVMKTQGGTYEPEDMLDEDIFQGDEYDNLIKALEKLNPMMTVTSTLN